MRVGEFVDAKSWAAPGTVNGKHRAECQWLREGGPPVNPQARIPADGYNARDAPIRLNNFFSLNSLSSEFAQARRQGTRVSTLVAALNERCRGLRDQRILEILAAYAIEC